MSRRRPKQRSARTKQLQRERRQREQRAAAYPLYAMQPPYTPYEQWISLPAGAVIDPWPESLPGGSAARFHATVSRLLPLYAGKLPLAAVYLDQQIERGILHIADPEDPELIAKVPVAEVAALFAADDVIGPAGDAGYGGLLHELHFHGALVVDDHHVICFNLTDPQV